MKIREHYDYKFDSALMICYFQIGSFFMINLCLVVIATQFSETKRRETAKMKAERARFRSSSTLSSFTNSETTNCYREIIKLIAHLIRKAMKKTRAAYRAMKIKQLQHKEKVLLEKKNTGKLQNYNVMKNVSTHSMVNVNDGNQLTCFLYCSISPMQFIKVFISDVFQLRGPENI